MSLLLTLLAPPLRVYFRRGFGGAFWLNVLLTLLFYVPGVVHAHRLVQRDRAHGRLVTSRTQKERRASP